MPTELQWLRERFKISRFSLHLPSIEPGAGPDKFAVSVGFREPPRGIVPIPGAGRQRLLPQPEPGSPAIHMFPVTVGEKNEQFLVNVLV